MKFRLFGSALLLAFTLSSHASPSAGEAELECNLYTAQQDYNTYQPVNRKLIRTEKSARFSLNDAASLEIPFPMAQPHVLKFHYSTQQDYFNPGVELQIVDAFILDGGYGTRKAVSHALLDLGQLQPGARVIFNNGYEHHGYYFYQCSIKFL